MILLWPFIFLDAVAAGYLAILALAALLPSRRRVLRPKSLPRIAVIVPAHNEQELLGGLLISLRLQDYPADLYEVHLIADNCNDETADIGRRFGINVHERHDPQHPGKGQALSWLLAQLMVDGSLDAFAFIDADSRVNSNFLSVMSRHLSSGSGVLQASYQVSDPSRSAITGLRALAFALMHDLRGRGKDRLGLSVGLWGNGMCMSRDVLAAVPWQSFSAVEDGEQHIQLLLRGYKSRFVGKTRVYGHMPTTLMASREQQQRWEGGKVYLMKHYWAALLRRCLTRVSPASGAAALELFLPPLSVQFALTLSIVPFVLILGNFAEIAVVVAAVAALGLYISSGLIAARMPPAVYASLLYAPVYLMWKVWLFATQLPKRAGPAWLRTTRDA